MQIKLGQEQNKQMQETRQHEQMLLDKKLQSEENKDLQDKAHESVENQKDRENELRKAEILAVSKIADNNYDEKFIPRIRENS